MKIAAFLWTVAIFLFGHGLTTGLAQQAIDFPTALELARKNNPGWRAAEQAVKIARGKLTIRLVRKLARISSHPGRT